ncbi:hypothetical protein [Dokdonella sp.]|uniref:M61 family metallopeptidase n=1 Tax=Dokdonella sp. TaxID=2291710 RepID=UPI003784C8D8
MPILIALLLLFGATRAGADEAPHYTLRYDANARTMAVALCLANAAPALRFSGDDSAPRNVEAPLRSSGGVLERDGDGWRARDWRAGECLRYSADLGRIGDAQARRSMLHARATITDPAGWLLMVDGSGDAQARVELPKGIAISTPWIPLASSDGVRRFRIPHTPADWLGRVALGACDERVIAMGGGRLHVALGAGVDLAQRDKLLRWLERVGHAAIPAHGRLPLTDVQVLVIPVGPQREAVVFGQSTRGQGNGLTLFVDPAQGAGEFDRDWVAVHEFSHLFHPHLGARGAWLAEGLATYWQNVLRARSGLLTPRRAWEELADGFVRGARDTRARARELEDASAAMERDHEFTRVYWSGTAYWLDADLALRRASDGRMSLDEVLRRFASCCLPSKRAWAPEAFVEKLDALAGSDVFARRWREYRALRVFPAAPDLESPADAAIRAAIMRPLPAPKVEG